MIKGIQKNIVVLKNTGSSVFEEAHFILKDGKENEKNGDIISEARRIIALNTVEPEKAFCLASEKKKERRNRLLFFLAGFLIGAGTAVLVFMI